jgi:hypothetical protein
LLRSTGLPCRRPAIDQGGPSAAGATLDVLEYSNYDGLVLAVLRKTGLHKTVRVRR